MLKIIALPNGDNGYDGENWGVQAQWLGALRIVFTGTIVSCGQYVTEAERIEREEAAA